MYIEMKRKPSFAVQLHLQPLLYSSVSEVAPTLPKNQAGWVRAGLLHMMFSMQKQRIWSLESYGKPFSTKNMHKNTRAKNWSGTYAAWSLGSPAPPVCVAAGASTAALHDHREKGEKETHQCKKQLKRHFQMHLVFFFGCQGTGEQQKKKTLLPPCCPALLQLQKWPPAVRFP